MDVDPREVINQSKMTMFQWIIIAITVGLNSLDGFDILSITFASSKIAAEWSVKNAALGVVLSMELIGMGLGSFFLGGIADKIGRRPTILSCLFVMSAGMLMVTTTGSILTLCFWRIVTGVGIGGMLAAINALAAEFSNVHRRHLCVSLMAIGYPFAGAVGGFIASALLANHNWRSIFYMGSFITACFIPLVYFVAPESVHWLVREQPAGALGKINKTIKKLGYDAIAALPKISKNEQRKSVGDIFGPRLLTTTIILAVTYFLHILTYYFILKWVPKIVVDLMKFDPSSAGYVLAWANVGGTVGGIIFGFLTLKFDLKKLSVGILFLSAVFIVIFGYTPADIHTMSMLCMFAGIFGNAGIIALYALVAHAYPTHARAFGTGFMLTVGRGGAVLSPIIVGLLRQMDMSLPSVALLMSIGSVVGAVVLLFLKLKSGDVSEEEGNKPSAAASAA
jgi:benzoate transport